MAEKNADLKKIKALIEIMKDNDLAEVEVKNGDEKIHLKRCQPQQTIIPAMPTQMVGFDGQTVLANNSGQPSVQAGAEAGQADGLVEIKAPLVGTFYAKPSPDSPPCVEKDSQVEEQTVVCIIEAMKVMNEIKAETSGTIVDILVTNGQAVEYGQVLFRVKPD